MASRLAKAGQAEQALKVATGIKGPRQRALALAGVASWLAKAGQTDQAAGLAAQVAQAATGIKEPDQQAEALAVVAGSLARAGRTEQALQAATGIKDPAKRTRALATLARSVGSESDGEIIYSAVCAVLLSPYARAYLAAIPVAVIERLLAEGRQI